MEYLGDIAMVVIIVLGLAILALYLLNRWSSKKMMEQQTLIDKTKMNASIYVIDKKKEKVTKVNLPKTVAEQMPKYYRFMKMPFVKAKIGPQIATLMCNKDVFDALPLKKNVSVELSGIYIVSMKGMKSKAELKKIKKDKEAAKKKEESEKKAEKKK